jgi:hypothetical protein
LGVGFLILQAVDFSNCGVFNFRREIFLVFDAIRFDAFEANDYFLFEALDSWNFRSF